MLLRRPLGCREQGGCLVRRPAQAASVCQPAMAHRLEMWPSGSSCRLLFQQALAVLASGTGRLIIEPATLLVTSTTRSCLPARLASEPADHSPMVGSNSWHAVMWAAWAAPCWPGQTANVCQWRRCSARSAGLHHVAIGEPGGDSCPCHEWLPMQLHVQHQTAAGSLP